MTPTSPTQAPPGLADPGIRVGCTPSGDSASTVRQLDKPAHLTLTVAETARALGVSVRVIHLRIKAGLLPAEKDGEHATSPYVIDAALVEYMAIQEARDRAARITRAARRTRRRSTSTAA